LNWDDPQYVTENRLIRTLSAANLKEIFGKPYFSLYIPLTLVSYALDYQVSLMNPLGYHITNLTLHLLNTGLVYALIALLTGQWLVAALTALLFGIHPVQIESVVWVAERKNVLSSFFFLSAFLTYVLSRLKTSRRTLFYLLSIGIFWAGCFAKPNVIVLPLLCVAYDYCFRTQRGKRGHESLLESLWRVLPYLVGAIVFAWITFAITRGEDKMNYHGNSFFVTILTMSVVLMKYAQLLLFPIGQSLLYEFPAYQHPAIPAVFFSILGCVAWCIGLSWLFRRDKKLFFFGAWFFILMLPMLNIVPFPSLMNDRYLYLPMIGVVCVVITLLLRWLGSKLAVSAILIVALVFSVLSLNRQKIWGDGERLWLETQAKTADLHQSPYLNLGMLYLRDGFPDKAIPEFEKVLTLTDDPNAYDGLGIAYLQKKDLSKAVEYLVQGRSKDAANSSIRSNLAIAYAQQGRLDKALTEFEEAVRLDPKDPKFNNNLASTYLKLGKREAAEKAFLETLKHDPDFKDALYNLGNLYYKDGRVARAKQVWQRLLKVHPRYPRNSEVRSKLAQIES